MAGMPVFAYDPAEWLTQWDVDCSSPPVVERSGKAENIRSKAAPIDPRIGVISVKAAMTRLLTLPGELQQDFVNDFCARFR